MRLEDLPEEDQKVFYSLRHGLKPIECVRDALHRANNLEEFRRLVTQSMRVLREETYEVQKLLGES